VFLNYFSGPLACPRRSYRAEVECTIFATPHFFDIDIGNRTIGSMPERPEAEVILPLWN
jgi:hypothetical protein